jgi:hypothetical protein
MWFILSTPVLIRHLWLLMTVVFLQKCLISAVLLSSLTQNDLQHFNFYIYCSSAEPIPTYVCSLDCRKFSDACSDVRRVGIFFLDELKEIPKLLLWAEQPLSRKQRKLKCFLRFKIYNGKKTLRR